MPRSLRHFPVLLLVSARSACGTIGDHRKLCHRFRHIGRQHFRREDATHCRQLREGVFHAPSYQGQHICSGTIACWLLTYRLREGTTSEFRLYAPTYAAAACFSPEWTMEFHQPRVGSFSDAGVDHAVGAQNYVANKYALQVAKPNWQDVIPGIPGVAQCAELPLLSIQFSAMKGDRQRARELEREFIYRTFRHVPDRCGSRLESPT